MNRSKPKKLWNVNGVVTAGKYLGQVRAATKEEAEEKAWKELDTYVSLCHQCSDQCEDPEIQRLEVYEVEESGESK